MTLDLTQETDVTLDLTQETDMTLDLTHLTQEQPMTQNVHKPKPSDMWIMYCIARYTDKGACSGQQRGL